MSQKRSPLILGSLLLGACLVIAGLVLGYSSITRSGVNCGSALGGETRKARVADLVNAYGGVSTAIAEQCESSLSDRTTTTWVLLAPGITLVIVGGVWWLSEWTPGRRRE
jgi:hypothetical protein